MKITYFIIAIVKTITMAVFSAVNVYWVYQNIKKQKATI